MSGYANLIEAMQAVIKRNGREEITGQILQDVLRGVILELGFGYQYGGIATLDGEAQETDAKVFYLATEPGTYEGYGGVVLTEGKLGVITYGEEWAIYAIPMLSSVNTDDIVDAAVTAPKIADDAVETAKIKDVAVTENKIADNAVTESKIADNAITENKVADNAVTENKVADDSISESKIKDNAVTENKIADNAVTENKLDDSVKGKIAKGIAEGYKLIGVVYSDEDDPIATPAVSGFIIVMRAGNYTEQYGLTVTESDGVCLFVYNIAAETPTWQKWALGLPLLPERKEFRIKAVEDSIIEFKTNSAAFFPLNTLTSIESSQDYGRTWEKITLNPRVATTQTWYIQAGKSLFVRATGTAWSTSSAIATLRMVSGNVKLSGNIMSLLTPLEEDFENKLTFDTQRALAGIFKSSFATIDAGELRLPATTLAERCYYEMFDSCSGLTTAPELPATTLASYCYLGMFEGCTSLTTAPELPATTLAPNCYRGMFKDCTSLTTAPELPATTLANNCYYQMFFNCSGLTTAPELPATTLTNSCYYEMFYYCSLIAAVTMLATDISASNCLKDWLKNVAATGVITKDASMVSLPSGTSGIPNGWTTVDA